MEDVYPHVLLFFEGVRTVGVILSQCLEGSGYANSIAVHRWVSSKFWPQ